MKFEDARTIWSLKLKSMQAPTPVSERRLDSVTWRTKFCHYTFTEFSNICSQHMIKVTRIEVPCMLTQMGTVTGMGVATLVFNVLIMNCQGVCS